MFDSSIGWGCRRVCSGFALRAFQHATQPCQERQKQKQCTNSHPREQRNCIPTSSTSPKSAGGRIVGSCHKTRRFLSKRSATCLGSFWVQDQGALCMEVLTSHVARLAQQGLLAGVSVLYFPLRVFGSFPSGMTVVGKRSCKRTLLHFWLLDLPIWS